MQVVVPLEIPLKNNSFMPIGTLQCAIYLFSFDFTLVVCVNWYLRHVIYAINYSVNNILFIRNKLFRTYAINYSVRAR